MRSRSPSSVAGRSRRSGRSGRSPRSPRSPLAPRPLPFSPLAPSPRPRPRSERSAPAFGSCPPSSISTRFLPVPGAGSPAITPAPSWSRSISSTVRMLPTGSSCFFSKARMSPRVKESMLNAAASAAVEGMSHMSVRSSFFPPPPPLPDSAFAFAFALSFFPRAGASCHSPSQFSSFLAPAFQSSQSLLPLPFQSLLLSQSSHCCCCWLPLL
mmetsp:Transcript_32806/g.97442  ORF Transcript_32806/g.97442 Transcript_32806/m.97442 type:complete len:212 (+) Transcript_32806:1199-1834(+)